MTKFIIVIPNIYGINELIDTELSVLPREGETIKLRGYYYTVNRITYEFSYKGNDRTKQETTFITLEIQ